MEFIQISREYMEKNVPLFIDITRNVPHEYWSDEHYLTDLPGKWDYSIAAVDNNKLAGFIIASKKETSVHIHKFMVHELFRNKGIGKWMLKEFENRIRQTGYLITLKVYNDNGSAIKFYLKQHFAVIQKNEDLSVMQKDNGKTVAIHQPNFLPWQGYFHKIISSDVFVILDNVDFQTGNSNSITSRTKIKSNTGELFLTVPVSRKNSSGLIMDINIDSAQPWKIKHLKTMKNFYAKAQHFKTVFPLIEEWYGVPFDKMAGFNYFLICEICKLLKINTSIIKSSGMDLASSGRNERIIEICRKLNSGIYFSGRNAKNYHDENLFRLQGISLRYTSFIPREYPQVNGAFIPGLSIIDVLLNCGVEETRKILQ